MNIEKLKRQFAELYQREAEHLYYAPSRINLIGEHCDYNGGYVLPCAINKGIYAAVSKRDDRLIRLHSNNFDYYKEQSLDDLEYKAENGWQNYPLGCFYYLLKYGYKIDQGLDILIDSDIPVGSGLSSSAAILVLTIYILNDLFSLELSKMQIASMAREVENGYCGVECGLMDQMAIAFARRDKALLLNCATLEDTYCNIKLKDCCFVVLNTNKPRALINSKFNERVAECREALEILRQNQTVHSLSELPSLNVDLPETLYKRVRHVFTEQKRVHDFVNALKSKYIKQLGEILNASHQSLKDDYEVSCEELDTICELANKYGAFGARMTGAGFGGCAIALIKKEDFEEFQKKASAEYYEHFHIEPTIFIVETSDGPHEIKKAE